MKTKIVLFLSLLSINAMAMNPPLVGICTTEPIEPSIPLAASALPNCSYQNLWENEIANIPYIPNSNSELITIKLNLHVMQKSDGTGNFQKTDDVLRFFENLVDGVNNQYANIEPPIWNGYRNDSYVKDSKIQFIIDGIYFHQDDNAIRTKPYDESYGRDNYSNKYGVNIDHSLNVFFTDLLDNNGEPYKSLGGNGFGLNGEARNCIGLYGYSYYYYTNPDVFGVMVFVFSHEIGHALGLMHTFQPDELSDTYHPEGKGWCSPCCDLNCSNNVMSDSNSRNYFSPLQLGKMRRLLTIGWRSKLQSNCNINNPITTLTQGENWDRPRALYGNLSTGNHTLTIGCKVYLPSNKSLQIETGGKLVLNSGSISNNCGERVHVLAKNGGCVEIKSTILDNCVITIQEGGTLIIDGTLNIKNQSRIDIQNGAYVCIRASSSINLIDSDSFINLYYGCMLGVNTKYESINSGCAINLAEIQVNGSGEIRNYNTDIYIQNEEIKQNSHFTGRNIYVGKNVTVTKPVGNVIISNNAHVIFDASGEVVFDKGFELKSGASMEVIKQE